MILHQIYISKWDQYECHMPSYVLNLFMYYLSKYYQLVYLFFTSTGSATHINPSA